MPDSIINDSAVYKTLLESTKAIPWKIDWATMTFAYIGPQIETLLGWPRASWASANDWAERMHPEDRDSVVAFCVSQSQAGTDHEADYRALTRDGGYVWISDVVHVLRNEAGEVESLIGFMFDISERKQTEQQLLQLQQQLEELSYLDGLTGVANRRMFDNRLQVEWSNAQRTSQPLSLILLDIDYFKEYNDHYGHIQGDDCLKNVALAHEQQIQHAHSQAAPLLTLSLGVGTLIPGPFDQPQAFIEQVDRLLYKAKHSGRNQAVLATTP